MSSPESLMVAGPNHPDLFDGESPVMLTLDKPIKAFQVRVTYTVTEYETDIVIVAARNSEEAARVAQKRVESRASENEKDHDVEDVEALTRPATATELRAWLARQEK